MGWTHRSFARRREASGQSVETMAAEVLPLLAWELVGAGKAPAVWEMPAAMAIELRLTHVLPAASPAVGLQPGRQLEQLLESVFNMCLLGNRLVTAHAVDDVANNAHTTLSLASMYVTRVRLRP